MTPTNDRSQAVDTRPAQDGSGRNFPAALAEYVLPLITFTATLSLTLIAGLVMQADKKASFVVFATGATISLAVALLDRRIQTSERQIDASVQREIGKYLDLHRILNGLDEELANEVYALARGLGAGQVPPHIAAVRMPLLYERAQHEVYASNVSLTRDQLCRWERNPRFKGIVATSARRKQEAGVNFIRTFILQRSEMLVDGKLEPETRRVLTAQRDAGIDVYIIWCEDIESDTVAPSRRLQQNFTIFDDVEAVDTTDVQVIYCPPSDRVAEFIALRREQLKYAERLDDYLVPSA